MAFRSRMTHRPVVHVFSWVKGLAEMIQTRCPHVPVKNIKIPPRFTNKKEDLEEESLQQLKKAEVLIVCPRSVRDFELLYELEAAKWVMSAWAGVDGIITCLDKARGLPKFTLTRFGGVFGPHMAEYVIGQIIRLERNFDGIQTAQNNSRWSNVDFCHYRLLQQLTLGIVGFGDIGNDVARAAKFFGMKVIGMSRRESIPEERAKYTDQYMPISRLDELLRESDYVCNILPSTPETRGLFSGEALKPCQNKKSVFINIGRGDVTDEKSILKALDEGWLSHVILDVHNPEPLPENSGLWKHSNVTITPHVSATSFADQVAEKFLLNYEKYTRGETLDYIVDWKAGY